MSACVRACARVYDYILWSSGSGRSACHGHLPLPFHYFLPLSLTPPHSHSPRPGHAAGDEGGGGRSSTALGSVTVALHPQ